MPVLVIKSDHRHNRADIYADGLLIGEAYLGGSNKTTRERQAWSAIAHAVSSHADMLESLQRLLKADQPYFLKDGTDPVAELGKARNQARAAILKATGGGL